MMVDDRGDPRRRRMLRIQATLFWLGLFLIALGVPRSSSLVITMVEAVVVFGLYAVWVVRFWPVLPGGPRPGDVSTP